MESISQRGPQLKSSDHDAVDPLFSFHSKKNARRAEVSWWYRGPYNGRWPWTFWLSTKVFRLPYGLFEQSVRILHRVSGIPVQLLGNNTTNVNRGESLPSTASTVVSPTLSAKHRLLIVVGRSRTVCLFRWLSVLKIVRPAQGAYSTNTCSGNVCEKISSNLFCIRLC